MEQTFVVKKVEKTVYRLSLEERGEIATGARVIGEFENEEDALRVMELLASD